MKKPVISIYRIGCYYFSVKKAEPQILRAAFFICSDCIDWFVNLYLNRSSLLEKATTLVETFACMTGDKGAGFKSAMSIMAAS